MCALDAVQHLFFKVRPSIFNHPPLMSLRSPLFRAHVLTLSHCKTIFMSRSVTTRPRYPHDHVPLPIKCITSTCSTNTATKPYYS
ncbi:hypothetical protein DM01DRAFT_1299494 [Hesseltinella vesiculosa]|uniref:Uncharacterized protein n=1 Tax=Hesseltinella vesiculosa TaxID=101127 RepID=A0A1X2GU20_9FUNG|nr:hypothetical protein DM01DRAFT_1299494 [Hesseltinella vesiculosa]